MIPFHSLAELFPLIEGDDFDQLVADVRAKGLLERIEILGGTILDGRNRYRAAIAAGLLDEDDAPEDRPGFFSRFVPDVDGDPLSFVISKNLKRRHLDDNQRASIGGKIANLSRGRPGTENPPIGGISVAQAAATLNVAPRQIERARVVHDQGVPELGDALDRGHIAVSAAEQIARKPEPEQRQELADRGILPNGARAIMGSRQEPDDSLDFFPTPPFATRALLTHVWARLGNPAFTSAWEPACGEGHISEVLREYFGEDRVAATDIHDYGNVDEVLDFLHVPNEKVRDADWVITNPPFGENAVKFVLQGLKAAHIGVAMFVRLQWLETIGRYETIFRDNPPTLIAFFAERVNLCKGRWDPDGGTATAYIWLVWMKGVAPQPPYWIPPGCREYLSRPDDRAKFAAWSLPTDDAGAPVPHDPASGEVLDEAAE